MNDILEVFVFWIPLILMSGVSIIFLVASCITLFMQWLGIEDNEEAESKRLEQERKLIEWSARRENMPKKICISEYNLDELHQALWNLYTELSRTRKMLDQLYTSDYLPKELEEMINQTLDRDIDALIKKAKNERD